MPPLSAALDVLMFLLDVPMPALGFLAAASSSDRRLRDTLDWSFLNMLAVQTCQFFSGLELIGSSP